MTGEEGRAVQGAKRKEPQLQDVETLTAGPREAETGAPGGSAVSGSGSAAADADPDEGGGDGEIPPADHETGTEKPVGREDGAAGQQDAKDGAAAEGAAGDGGAGAGQESPALEREERPDETERLALDAVEARLSQLAGAVERQSALLKSVGGAGKEEADRNELRELAEMVKAALSDLEEKISAAAVGVRRNVELLEGVRDALAGHGRDLRGIVEGGAQGTGVEELVEGVRSALEEQSRDLKAATENGAPEKGGGELLERLSAEVRAYTADTNMGRGFSRPLRWAALSALSVAAPALLLAGTFVGQQWQVLPLKDGTGGWRGHVWEHYGDEIVGCVKRAYGDGSSSECVVDVRPSVEQVRRAAGR